MSNKKYEFTGKSRVNSSGVEVRQIRFIRDIPQHGVSAGDLGGWIQYESNLDPFGDARVLGNARVSGDAVVFGDADHMTIGPIGREDRFATITRNKENSAQIVVGCWGPGSREDLKNEVKWRRENLWNERVDVTSMDLWESQYKLVRKFAKLMEDSWKV